MNYNFDFVQNFNVSNVRRVWLKVSIYSTLFFFKILTMIGALRDYKIGLS